MIEFVYPLFFILLPLPLLIVWLAPVYKEKKSSVKVPYFARLVDVTGEKPQSGAVLLSRNNFQRLIVAFSWACIVTSLAKPEIIGEPITLEKSARDLMIAVDLSGSMAVEDFALASLTSDNGSIGKNTTVKTETKVNRLVAVKQVLSQFVKGREHDRLGLILFGDAAYLQAPFTQDNQIWLTLLDETEIGMAGQSTALGDAIGLAISVFESSETKNRVLIALTDGNDTGSKVPPIEAAKVAAAYDIKIYTIAIGDPTAVGEEKVDLAVLEEMAQVTGGMSFQALNRDELEKVYQKIDEMEPQKFDSLSFRPRTSAHHYPIVLFACIYIFALFIVNVKIRRQININEKSALTNVNEAKTLGGKNV